MVEQPKVIGNKLGGSTEPMEPKKPGELDERMIAMLQSEGGRSTITYDDDEEDLPDQGRTTITYDDEEEEQFQ